MLFRSVAQDQKTCATGKLMCVAQYNMVRHVYLAMAHCFYCAPRLLGLPISLFLLVLANLYVSISDILTQIVKAALDMFCVLM